MDYELSPKARELLAEASKDPGGMITRGAEDWHPGSTDVLSETRNMMASLTLTGSAVSNAPLGFHTHGRFFPMMGEYPHLDGGFDSGFIELLEGDFIEVVPNTGRMSFKVTSKGHAAVRQLATT